MARRCHCASFHCIGGMTLGAAAGVVKRPTVRSVAGNRESPVAYNCADELRR